VNLRPWAVGLLEQPLAATWDRVGFILLTLSTLALILYTIVFFVVLFLFPIYLQSVHGESSAEAGTI